ncbi:MAG TPA: hypothetical protein PLD47_18610 [Aggregatilineales bacterium]|nr:hypothetical protein [Anaerolineales bacterium]HRE49742.1 hypothetical protein [Aggregatilineales bacterium]
MQTPSSPAVPSLSGVISALALIFIFIFSGLAVSVFGEVSAQRSTLRGAAPINAPSFAAEVEERVARADPKRGDAFFKQYACSACHLVDRNLVGPMIIGMGERAASRRPNYSAAAYLYEAIVAPNAYVVKDFAAGVMLQNFKETIPESALYDLIAWLITQ